MSRRTMWLLPLLFATACERPTAPEAHNIARQTERRFAEGDFDGIGNMFLGQTGAFAHNIRQTQLNRAMLLSRGGRSESISGFVIEEVLIAPGGAGRPRVRRTLIGWPDDFAFALHATTDAAAGYMAFLTDSAPRLSASSGITIRQRRSKSWRGVTGTVMIGEPMIDASCGTANEMPLRILDSGTPGTVCEFALYEVDVYGDLVLDGASQGPFGKLFERREIVRVTPQKVPGVRFTVQCPDFKPGDRFGTESFEPHNRECGFPWQFWRHNELFARELGVDVAQMRAPQGLDVEGWYVQKWPRLTGDSAGPLITRWTIHTPDGRLVEADSAGPNIDRPVRRDLDWWGVKAQFGIADRRFRALIPASEVDPAASRFNVLVLNVDIGRPETSPFSHRPPNAVTPMQPRP